MDKFTEEEWALFTGLYDDAVDFYVHEIEALPKEEQEEIKKKLNSIRDKLYEFVAPEPKEKPKG